MFSVERKLKIKIRGKEYKIHLIILEEKLKYLGGREKREDI